MPMLLLTRLRMEPKLMPGAEGTVAAEQRDQIHERMLQAWGLTDRGTKTASFFRAAEYHDARFALRDGLYQQPRRCLASG